MKAAFDKKTMKFTIVHWDDDDEELETEVPAKYEVCGRCNGKGTHINPNVDGHGISQEEFDEDPDFKENYFGGVYDVACHECDGANVVPVFDYDHMTDEQKELAEDHERGEYQDRRERESEERFGY